MKLARKLTTAIVGGICLVGVVSAHFRIIHETALFQNDMRRDHVTLGNAIGVGFHHLWKREGEKKALTYLQNINAHYSHISIRWIPEISDLERSSHVKCDSSELIGLRNGNPVSKIAHSGDSYDSLVTYVPLNISSSKHTGVLELSESLDEQAAYIWAMIQGILYRTLAMIVVTSVITIILSQWMIGRPLRRLTEIARRIASGDLSEIETMNRTDEVGILASEMAQMCRQLADGRDRQNTLIADMKQKEKTLTASLRLIESILEDAPIGRGYLDRDLRYVQVNETLARLAGKSVSDHLGRTIGTVFPQASSELEPRLNEVIKSGQPLMDWETSSFSVGSNATSRNWQCTFYPVRNELKEVQGVGMAVLDITERKQSENLRKKLLVYTVSMQEEERRRIARELHDGIGQILSALSLQSRTLESQVVSDEGRRQLEDFRRRLLSALDEISRMVQGLHPILLDDLGFSEAVDRLSKDFITSDGLQIDTQIVGIDSGPRLPLTLETALYRILQEALNNVARHAQATSASVVIERLPRLIQTIVEDNGRGFDPEDKEHQGLGLLSIRERVEVLGGTLEIESSPGQGATLYIRVPIADGASWQSAKSS